MSLLLTSLFLCHPKDKSVLSALIVKNDYQKKRDMPRITTERVLECCRGFKRKDISHDKCQLIQKGFEIGVNEFLDSI